MTPRFRSRGFYEGSRAAGPHIPDGTVSFLVRLSHWWVATHAPANSRYGQVLDMIIWDSSNLAFRSPDYIMQPGPHIWEEPRVVVRRRCRGHFD